MWHAAKALRPELNRARLHIWHALLPLDHLRVVVEIFKSKPKCWKDQPTNILTLPSLEVSAGMATRHDSLNLLYMMGCVWTERENNSINRKGLTSCAIQSKWNIKMPTYGAINHISSFPAPSSSLQPDLAGTKIITIAVISATDVTWSTFLKC